jgi:hypothetical protein
MTSGFVVELVCAGYGIYYDIVPTSASSGGVPFVINEPAQTNSTTNPEVILPRVFTSSAVAGPSTVSLPQARNPHLVIPYSMQYSATIERAFGGNALRLSFIGTNTRKGEYAYNINQPLPGPGAFISKPRMFPQYPAIMYLTNGAGHQYNAFTAEIKRRSQVGLTYQLSYTLARDIGDVERGESIENAYNRARERTVWVDIPTHRLNGNVYWELPLGRGKRFLAGASRPLDAVAGGWSIALVYSYRSGRFLTPLWTGPDPTGTAYTTNASPPNVTIRPDILRDGNLPPDQRSIYRWFDLAAFAPPGPYFGTSARGVIIGPNSNVWDAGVYKLFRIAERVTLRWEMTAVNMLNHPNYNDPSMTINQTGSNGVINGVGGNSNVSGAGSPLDPAGPRGFRTALRLEF